MIDRDLFITAIESLERQYKADETINRTFKSIIPELETQISDSKYIANAVIEILQKTSCDNFPSLIEYYCFDLDFGKEVGPKDTMMPAVINSAGELYDLLKERHSNGIIRG